jgi:hypothetical protein
MRSDTHNGDAVSRKCTSVHPHPQVHACMSARAAKAAPGRRRSLCMRMMDGVEGVCAGVACSVAWMVGEDGIRVRT